MNMKLLSLTIGVVLLGVSHAAADTIYTYTGNDFNYRHWSLHNY